MIKVADTHEIPSGSVKCVMVKRRAIAIFNVEGTFHAIDDTCTHADASLSEGRVEGCKVFCPLHGARFDVTTGDAETMPAVTPVERYKVTVHESAIMLEV